jgi:amino acid permease
MFGLPYLTSRAGLVPFFIFLVVLGFVQYFTQLVFANMIVSTESFHRLPGYVGVYLGKNSKTVVFVAKIAGNIGALLAYTIITGIFLNQLLSPFFGGSEFIYATVTMLISAFVVYYGIAMIARFELLMSSLLLIVVAVMAIRGLPVISDANFVALDWKYFILPYGAMLLALDGNGALPMVAKILKKDHIRIKSVIRVSLLVSSLVMILFVLTIVGISGPATSPDALKGIDNLLGGGVTALALILGVLCMATSILGVSEDVKETLQWDYGFNEKFSWAIAVFTPYILYILGFQDLIKVINFIGAIMGGVCAVMLTLAFRELKKRDHLLIMFTHKPGKLAIFLLLSLLAIGFFHEIISSLIDLLK